MASKKGEIFQHAWRGDRALTAELWRQPAFEGLNAFLITDTLKQGLNLTFKSLVISVLLS